MLSQDVITCNPNPLVQALGKPASEFTKADIIAYVRDHGIEMVNFRFVAGDGRLKTLQFVIGSLAHLDRILSFGERVDGSSLFDYVDADSSDVYVVPRFSTAFVNPFAARPSVDLLCSFYDASGRPMASAPEQILRKAQRSLRRSTGYTLEAFGELEYYIFTVPDPIFPVEQQRGYTESHPFSKWGEVREEAMAIIASMGCQVKYGHSEVGNIVEGDVSMVQSEIEFLPVPIEDAAEQLAIAAWVLREVAYRKGLEVSFAPKIVVGQAGSGMHIHMRLMRDGRNALMDESGLTDDARRLIAGLLLSAGSLTAFGNTVPTSFLRLVPHQEAPTSVCWGYHNRSALVRVPLGWEGVGDRMLRDANPLEPPIPGLDPEAQTVEIRSPDGSANVHLLMAAIAMAAKHGLEHPEALRVAAQLELTGDATGQSFPRLPDSCWAAAEALIEDRARYEADGVFPPGTLDAHAAMLRSHHDADLAKRIAGDRDAVAALVRRHLHCG